MNFLSALLKNDKDEHNIKARRMQAMRDIIAVIGPVPFVDAKIEDYYNDFENEEWLITQMEKVPMVISKLIEKCDTNSIEHKEHIEKLTDKVVKINDLNRELAIIKSEKSKLVHENQRLKEENELLKSDKVKVVILRE
jgi:hypothetical protein